MKIVGCDLHTRYQQIAMGVAQVAGCPRFAPPYERSILGRPDLGALTWVKEESIEATDQSFLAIARCPL
jgi:hypothetical protein